ncbi:tetratricopeptide repeat protein [Peribacillus kribbensis]|uniref:tetratricopeptide repeat protein n=1 Tax=Peribacillus kribbensis TaxID=356658 RepID=UPI000429D0A5|nr:tetratricopeptide repeat protein [Peribacillus kribbensis]
MNTNQRANELLERNQYEEALRLFKKAVLESRTVQSLNNLAWIYSNEEDDDASALPLVKEAIRMQPASHFPYNLLGEIYGREQKWKEAIEVLLKAISIQPSQAAHHNLGAANYKLGYSEEAAKYFLLAAVESESDFTMYCHVKCLIEMGHTGEAKKRLDAFSEVDEEFVGEADLADMYAELGCFEEAVDWFEKGWDFYGKQTAWVSRFVFSLLKVNNPERAHGIIHQALNEHLAELKNAYDEEVNEDWSESDKSEYIQKLLDEKKNYEQMFEKISSGFIPPMDFDVFITTSCYLFGCTRHKHPEYQE